MSRWTRPRVAVAAMYVAGMFVSIMDTAIVNTALPSLGREFGAPATSAAGVVTVYLVSLAVFIPAAGWVGDRFGAKRTMLVALALFTVASAFCGLAPSLPWLIAMRAFQGAAGGMLGPVGLTMLYRAFPPAERIAIGRVLMVPALVAPAIGPVLGGVLTQALSWRWVFFINLPIGIVALAYGLFFLPEQRQDRPGRFDLRGFLSAGIGFGLLTFAIGQGSETGWGNPAVLEALVAGLGVLVIFVVVELTTEQPMVDLRLYGQRLYRVITLASLLVGACFSAVLYLTPIFLQVGRGASPIASGLTTFPEAIGVACGIQVAAHLFERQGPRRLIAASGFALAAAVASLSLVGFETPVPIVMLLMFLIGGCLALELLPSQTEAFAEISAASTGRASALFGATERFGGAAGVAVVTTVVREISAPGSPGGSSLSGFHAGFIAAATLALCGGLVALWLPVRRASVRRPAVSGGEGGTV